MCANCEMSSKGRFYWRKPISFGREAFNSFLRGPSPSRLAAGRELLAAVRVRLSPDELRLADLRGQGREWTEVAEEMGGTAQARRKQLQRALDRVAKDLGLDETDHA